MSNVPNDLKYTRSHEWVRRRGDGTVEIGITDHAQSALGDLVFVEVPEAGRALKAGDTFAVVESVKAASDVYAPLAGEVVEINETLVDNPATVNADPQGAGWFFKMKLADVKAIDGLMDEAAYRKHIA